MFPGLLGSQKIIGSSLPVFVCVNTCESLLGAGLGVSTHRRRSLHRGSSNTQRREPALLRATLSTTQPPPPGHWTQRVPAAVPHWPAPPGLQAQTWSTKALPRCQRKGADELGCEANSRVLQLGRQAAIRHSARQGPQDSWGGALGAKGASARPAGRHPKRRLTHPSGCHT